MGQDARDFNVSYLAEFSTDASVEECLETANENVLFRDLLLEDDVEELSTH